MIMNCDKIRIQMVSVVPCEVTILELAWGDRRKRATLVDRSGSPPEIPPRHKSTALPLH